jgi:hypothetical protein
MNVKIPGVTLVAILVSLLDASVLAAAVEINKIKKLADQF